MTSIVSWSWAKANNIKTTLGVASILILATACDPAPKPLKSVNDGINAPVGFSRVDEAVDGLIVGHRLMAGGEYELAIRAYNRAAVDQGFSVDVLSALGSANLRLGRLGQAKQLLELAVEKDKEFVPAWNNLGVVLSNQQQYGEAERIFRLAFALDSGKSDEIRANLTQAIANLEESRYSTVNNNNNFALVRRGNGRYLLLKS